MAEKKRIRNILYSICALLLLSGAVYGATVAEIEPNDNDEQAMAINAGDIVSGVWQYDGGSDRFKLTFPQSGIATVSFSGPTDCKFQVGASGFGQYPTTSIGWVNGENGKPVTFSFAANGNKLGYIWLNIYGTAGSVAGGDWHLVRCNNEGPFYALPNAPPLALSTQMPTSWDGKPVLPALIYNLQVTLQPLPDMYEPNNNKDEITQTIPVGQEITAYLFNEYPQLMKGTPGWENLAFYGGENDVDIYRISLSQPDTVNVQLSNFPANANNKIMITQSDGNWDASDNGATQFSYKATKPGNVFIEISKGSGTSNLVYSTTPYKLIVTTGAGTTPSIPAGDTPIPSTTSMLKGTVTLKNHYDTGEVFSFDIGSVESFWGGQTKGDVTIEYSEGKIKSTNGIPETIQDVGTANLDSLTTAPTTGYTVENNAIQGHSYWVKTSKGKYAKINVKSVDTGAITFDWVYQPDGSTNLGIVIDTITPVPPKLASGELITNGDFSKGLNGWTIEEWFKPSDGKGEVTAESDGIRFQSKTGNTRIGIMQTLNADVSKCNALNLRATIKADEQTLSGMGYNGREAPIAVFARYTDVNGAVHGNLGEDPRDAKRMHWYGLYFIDPTGQSITDFGIKTQKGEWYTYEADLMKLSPKPKTIDFIGAEGAGWASRSGKIKSISLTCAAAGGVTPPVPVTEPNYIYAEDRTVAVGENVLVPINIKNAKNIGNMDLLLNYDPKVLKPIEVRKGSLTDNTMFESNIQVAPEIRISFASTKGVNGDGSIAYINFQAVGSAGSTSRISFVDVLANEAGTMAKLGGKSIDADVKVVASVNARKGDVNGDGKISSVDALMALKMSVRTIPATAAADVDGDGRVTSIDAGKILQAATGKITL